MSVATPKAFAKALAVPVAAVDPGLPSAGLRSRPGGVIGGLLSQVADGVEQFLGRVGLLFSGLPANPVTDLLSGGLWLIRRTLFPASTAGALCVAVKRCGGKDLTGVDLSGQTLTGVRFNGATLDRANLSGADLSNVELDYAKLRGADLTGANLFQANLYGADLVGADLDGVRNFGTATLSEANLSGQALIRLNLAGIDLYKTNLFGAVLTGSDLRGARLDGADLRSAKLVGVMLDGASIGGTNLTDADVRGAQLDPGADSSAVGGSVDEVPGVSDPSIATNPAFSYQDAILAGRFAELAYKWREKNFADLVAATGWQGIRVAGDDRSPAAGGLIASGFQGDMPVNSYAFAGRRTVSDGTEQFVFAVEGSNECDKECFLDRDYAASTRRGQDREDWNANIQQYGWSRYYASLQPLMAEVLRQMIDVQQSGKKAQLIITGHSLGGAVAVMAYADLIDRIGDLYPLGQTDVLASGERIWDKLWDPDQRDGWDSYTREEVIGATTVYTFGAPSPLMDPVKVPEGLNAVLKDLSNWDIGRIWDKALSSLKVRDDLLPEPFRGEHDIASERIFQFEHKGVTFYTEAGSIGYADDIVAALGNRDPGYVFGIKLRPDIHEGYAGGGSAAQGFAGISAATHNVGLYNESLIRLATWDALLADSTPVESVVGWPTTGGQGSDARNDVFRETSGVGAGGNDWFGFTRPGDYSAVGGPGDDLLALGHGVTLTIDGAKEGTGSGSDGVIFFGSRGARLGVPAVSTEVMGPFSGAHGVTVVYTVKGGTSTSSLTVNNWDEWSPSDIYTTNTVDRWVLERFNGKVQVGPVS